MQFQISICILGAMPPWYIISLQITGITSLETVSLESNPWYVASLESTSKDTT